MKTKSIPPIIIEQVEQFRREEFAKLICEYIDHHHQSVSKLADFAECARSTVHRWATGKCSPRRRTRQWITDHINAARVFEGW